MRHNSPYSHLPDLGQEAGQVQQVVDPQRRPDTLVRGFTEEHAVFAQVWAKPTISNLWPTRGWKGWVTTKAP